MQAPSLGEFIRELRDKADLSLRDVAKKIGVSAPFLSDIELGRRNPGEDTLAAIAQALKVNLEELKQYDQRESVADFKKLLETNPSLGLAFRTAVTEVKQGKMTADELTRKIAGKK